MATVEKKRTTDQKRTSGTYGPWGPQADPTNSPFFSMQSWNEKDKQWVSFFFSYLKHRKVHSQQHEGEWITNSCLSGFLFLYLNSSLTTTVIHFWTSCSFKCYKFPKHKHNHTDICSTCCYCHSYPLKDNDLFSFYDDLTDVIQSIAAPISLISLNSLSIMSFKSDILIPMETWHVKLMQVKKKISIILKTSEYLDFDYFGFVVYCHKIIFDASGFHRVGE